MNDPHPLEQASFRMAFEIMPFLIQSAFMSWPPMSSTNVRRCSRTSATHSWSTSMSLFQPLRCLGQQMLMCFSYGRASARVSLSLSSQIGGAEFIAFSKFFPCKDGNAMSSSKMARIFFSARGRLA